MTGDEGRDENEDYDDAIDEQSPIEFYESESERIWENNFGCGTYEDDEDEL